MRGTYPQSTAGKILGWHKPQVPPRTAYEYISISDLTNTGIYKLKIKNKLEKI